MIKHNDIIRKVCRKSGVAPLVGNAIMRAFFLTIKEEICKGNEVLLQHFGKFYLYMPRTIKSAIKPKNGIVRPKQKKIGFKGQDGYKTMVYDKEK